MKDRKVDKEYSPITLAQMDKRTVFSMFREFFKSPWIVIVISGFLAILSIFLTKQSEPKPALMTFTLDLVNHRSVPCFNLGYVFFSALFYMLGGNSGFLLGQVLIYSLIGITAYFILDKILDRNKFIPTLGAVLVLIYPEAWLNVHRVIETNLAMLLCLLFVYFLLPSVQKEMTVITAAFVGFVFAYMILTRSNLIVMLPLFIIPISKSFKNFSTAIIVVLVTLSVIPGISTDHFYPKPQEGVYTFFIGANPYTKETLLKYLTGEPVSPELIKKMKIDPTVFSNNTGVLIVDREIISKMAQYSLIWIINHPFDYLELIPVKFWTLIRLDLRGAKRQIDGKIFIYSFFQILMTLIFPLWFLGKLIFHKNGIFYPLGVTPFAILYLIPFLLTNADPRFRQPLDVLFLLEITVFSTKLLSKNRKMENFQPTNQNNKTPI